MNQIKFSHKYDKLDIIEIDYPVTLLEVFTKQTADLSPAFIEYDTSYFNGKINEKYKPSKGEHLILLFKDDRGNLFTTVRSRYGNKSDKFPYYNSKRGEAFEIVYTNVGAE